MTHYKHTPMKHSKDTRVLQHFINRWPIRVFYQHQGMCVNTWVQIRRALGPHTGLSIVKSSQLPLVLPTETKSKVYFQGSCCVFGVSRLEDIISLYRVCAMYPNTMVCIGGHWHKKYWTHMDISHVAHLSEKTLLHKDLCDILYQSSIDLHTSMDSSQGKFMDILHTPTHTLLSLVQR